MTTITGAARQQQRIEHLVLGRPRPTPIVKKPRGMTRLDWKGCKAAHLAKAVQDAELLDEFEERVALRERWAAKKGTPETHEHADRARRRAGCLARLYATGTINADQLAAAQAIAETYEAIGAIVGVKSSFAALDRVDCGFRPDQAGEGVTRSVWMELRYDRWRRTVAGPIAAVLAMIVHDAGLVAVARHYQMSDRAARKVLVDALDLWIQIRA